MKKFVAIYLTIGLGLSTFPMSAQHVTKNVALEKAVAFFQKCGGSNSNMRRASRKAPKLVLANNRDEFYIFNDEANGGYVIISGDECTPSILGYSETGKIDDNMSENMRSWLQEYANQIVCLRNHSGIKSHHATQTKASISPLLGETAWGQNTPFNLFCPEYESQQTVTGCVATAMAQIMYYYRWPNTTTKEIPGYNTETLNLSVSSIPVHSIDWNNILPKYNSGSETQVQKDAVARLMLMCGTSLKMDYNMDGSSSSVDDIAFSLKEYFDYASTAKILRSWEYSLDQLNQIVYKELASGRPTCLGGQNSAGQGHAFVVDGYDKDDYFHINWGWNGENNGYFLLSLVDPNNIGEGYNRYPVCVVGIKRSIDINPDGDNDGDLIVTQTTEGVDMSFEIISVDDKTCEVKGNDSYAPAIDPATTGTVTIPEYVNGYKVISIGPCAFHHCGEIQKVIMPQTITRIGHDAFYYCSKMESADIPLGVKQIDYQAFDGCSSLTSIVIPDGVTVIPYNAFTGTGITSIVPPGYEREATSCVIPESVTRIVGQAFLCGNLVSVTLPAGVKEVGGNMACASFGNPFVGCTSLRILDVEEGNPYYHAEGNCIIESATNCISIGCNYSEIPSYAKHIGQGAFCNLSFEEFVVPEGIVSVEKDAFNNSFYLKEVTLPSTLTSLDEYAFYACTKLKTLKVKMKSPIAIGDIFRGTALKNLYVPAGTKALYEAADGWKNFTNIVEMEPGDVNFDNIVDVADIASIVDCMSGSTDVSSASADVNGDGVVNVADIAAIIDIIAGKGGETPEEKAYTTCPDDHHPHMIDLGLPSGTKWACCNVGASTPEGYGNYYAWGETQPKEVYNQGTYIHCDGTYNALHNIGSDIAGTEYDAATANWKAPWRMPTLEQCKELFDNCTSEWTTQNDVNGTKFTGANGGTIFLPGAGVRWNSNLLYVGTCCDYWSSTLREDYPYSAWRLYVDLGYADCYNNGDRCGGLSVRPVR